MSEPQFVVYFDVGAVGCYAHDLDGNPWASFEAINHTHRCGVCDAEINRGWSRGKLGNEMYVCSGHVRVGRCVKVALVEYLAPLPVIMEDKLIHRLPDHPFCDNPECLCHQDDELFSEYVEKPVMDGKFAVYEAVRIYWNETI